MKKLLLLLTLGFGLALTPTAVNATVPVIPPVFPPENPVQLKVDLCHNGTIIPISINAVGGLTADLNGHGLLTLSATGQVVSFVKADGEGHSMDTVLRVYLKHGNGEVNLDVESGTCEKPEEPEIPKVKCADFETIAELEAYLATLDADVRAKVVAELDADKDGVLCEKDLPTTTTTVPESTSTTVPPTVITETESPTITVPIAPVPQLLPKPQSQPQPVQELPRTGSGPLLAGIGTGVTALGVVLRRLFK